MTKAETVELKQSNCWQCGAEHNAMERLEDMAVEAADIGDMATETVASICIHCGAVSMCDRPFKALRPPSHQEAYDVYSAPQTARLIANIKHKQMTLPEPSTLIH